jgi:SAM-dependent methyltransferase
MIRNGLTCNLCGNDRFRVLEDTEAPVYVLKCLCCELVFVDPVPTPNSLITHYDAGYYAEWLENQREKRIRMWRRRLQTIEQYKPIGRLLDVGCATGDFLELAQRNGWHVDGTEYSPYAAAFARDLLKTDIFCGHLMDAPYEDVSFDVVTFWHVLEHVADPIRYLLEAHRILKPSGLLVVAVPNVNDYIMKTAYRIVKGRSLKLFSRDDREIHLYHFSADTLKQYLHKAGFDCLSISPDYGITEHSKRLVNFIAVALSYATGMKLFNALEAHAVRL